MILSFRNCSDLPCTMCAKDHQEHQPDACCDRQTGDAGVSPEGGVADLEASPLPVCRSMSSGPMS